MVTRLLNIQQDLAINKSGRFIPYIGKYYINGLRTATGTFRILIIGPRHYCDGIYNSRNILIGLDSETKIKLKSGSCFPDIFTVGCTKEKASGCLKENEGRSCPVYRHKACPLIGDCDIKHIFSCNGERNLRCETLYAINEFIGKPEIESARLGISYFGQITKFIRSHFNPNVTHVSHIWGKIAFFNLIQRYIPLKDVYFDSNLIGRYITQEDVEVGNILIQKLNPDIIIMTMPCLSTALNTNLNNAGYTIVRRSISYGYEIYSHKPSTIKLSKPEWQMRIDEITNKYLLPELSSQLRTFAQEILYEVIWQFRSEIDGKSPENEVRKYLHLIICEKIKQSESVSRSISSISCFKESCENPIEAMRQWMRYNKKN